MATTPKCNNGWQTCECTVTRCSKYDGDNLTNTGIKTGDTVTVALQKIDNALNPLTITQNILTTLENNLVLQAQFCNIVNNCIPTTTTTTTTTTSTSTTTSTTTQPPSLRLLFDFSETGSYSNSGTAIADLSGNFNNGVFSSGTGNGTPTTVTGYSTNGYLNLPGTASQLSVKLPNSLKPAGTVPFTYIVYMQPNGYSYNGNFPGIISNGASPGNVGLQWQISPSFTAPGQAATRAASPSANLVELAYSGGAGLGVWSVYAIKFDGTSTTLYQYYNGTLYTANTVGATSISSSPSWGLFLGLRYNMWINAKINYVAMYNAALSDLYIETLANTLSQRIIL